MALSRKSCVSAVFAKRALPDESPDGTGSAPSAAMVVSCTVMLTCDAAASVPVLMLQRSTPQPAAVIASLSFSSPGIPACLQAAIERATATNAANR